VKAGGAPASPVTLVEPDEESERMLSIDETIQNVEKLYQAVTGRPAPDPDGNYSPIPAEKDPVEHIEEQLSRLLSAVGQTMQGAEEAVARATWAPPLTVWENDREMVLAFELPGVPRESVQAVMQGNLLTVHGERPARRGDLALRAAERPVGPFRRTVPLPATTRSVEPAAEMKDGILEIRIPKEGRETAAPREIPVH
jgi:HSP20 family protein